jgi:hypothetical protein
MTSIWDGYSGRSCEFVTGYAFEDGGGGRNDSTGAASAIGGATNNARTPVVFPFPK